jgi:type IV secretion system protein VirB9
MTMKRVLFSLLPILLASPVLAQPVTDFDSRLRVIDYDPTAVVQMLGCAGFQTTVTLASNEQVENVSVGDSANWQVTVNKRGNLVFVKPVSPKGFTNMTVITNRRSYNFELRTASEKACRSGDVTYELRFRYAPEPSTGTPAAPTRPADPNAFLPAPEKRNTAYSFVGAADLIPVRVFDDGALTYFRWSPGIPAPAVYALNSDNTESLVNYASRGDYLVVEQVAPGYVLRRGSLKSTLYNDAFKVQGLDAQSPKPRQK